MCKEIEFRAWNTGVKAMLHFSNPIGIADDSDRYGIFFKADEGKMYIGGSYEIMQYTGLKDKKRTEQYPEGQEIYEGDIVKFGEDEIPYEVYQHDSGSWDAKGLSLWEWISENGDENEWEIIGNIYENPELLKEDESC